MSMKLRKFVSLVFWMVGLITIGWLIGSLSRAEVETWYVALHRSSLTPPNYIFPIAWTILYALIGAAGWVIWQEKDQVKNRAIKCFYVAQLLLNWSWSPLFFRYHFIELALFVLLAINILVSLIIWQSLPKTKSVAFLMTPYLLWSLFATYLNFFIYWHN